MFLIRVNQTHPWSHVVVVIAVKSVVRRSKRKQQNNLAYFIHFTIFGMKQTVKYIIFAVYSKFLKQRKWQITMDIYAVIFVVPNFLNFGSKI